MVETVTAMGIVISAMPMSEYDKRVVLLTKQFGKITAFARGARRPTSQFLSGTQPMSFGEFTMYRGRNSYTITNVKVTEYFGGEMTNINKMYMGMYFLEMADYYGRENIDGTETLKLIYLSLKALQNDSIPDKLVKNIYELKSLVINGEYPNVFTCVNCGNNSELDYFDLRKNGMICSKCHGNLSKDKLVSQSAVYALQYIISSPLNKLYTFNVKDEVWQEINGIIESYLKEHIEKQFKTLEFLEISY